MRAAVTSLETQTRLSDLEAAIRQHREEKSTVPDCTCWVTHAQRLDAALYACLGQPGPPEERVARLEEAIRQNRLGKKDVSDCPCWGNAPQLVDRELFALLAD
jgi:hypothetical protein